MDAGVNCSRGKTHGESHSENDQTGGFATSAASLQLHPEHYLRDRGPGSGTVESPTVLLGAFGAVPIGIATQTANYNICRLARQTKISKITKHAGIWLVVLVEPSGVKQIKQTTTTAKKTINLRHSIFFAKHSSLTLLPFANMGRLRVSASDIFILSTTWQGLCLLSSSLDPGWWGLFWFLQLKSCSRICPITDLNLHTQSSEVWRHNRMPPISVHTAAIVPIVFSKATRGCKSKHVNCSKKRITSAVMPENGNPRQPLGGAGRQQKQQECPILNFELWSLYRKVHQTIYSKTKYRRYDYSSTKMPNPGNTILRKSKKHIN